MPFLLVSNDLFLILSSVYDKCSCLFLCFQLIYLKVTALLFPTSDFRHPVTTPALLYISQALTKVHTVFNGFAIVCVVRVLFSPSCLEWDFTISHSVWIQPSSSSFFLCWFVWKRLSIYTPQTFSIIHYEFSRSQQLSKATTVVFFPLLQLRHSVFNVEVNLLLKWHQINAWWKAV